MSWRNRIVGHGEEDPEQLLANPANWRIHPQAQQAALKGVLDEVGLVQSVLVNKVTGHLVDGHLRVTLAMRHGQKSLPVTYVELSEAEEAEVLATLDPLSAMAAADTGKLDELLRDVQSGESAVQQMLAELAQENGLYTEPESADDAHARKTLAERFVVPPFSVLDARQGYWQERKRAWLALGIQSELGRGDCMPSGASCVDAGSSEWAGYRGPQRAERERESNAQDGDAQRPDAAQGKVRRGYARCFGQDLMRGEHKVGT